MSNADLIAPAALDAVYARLADLRLLADAMRMYGQMRQKADLHRVF